MVDAVDAHLLINHSWSLMRSYRVFYAQSGTYARRHKTSDRLHRAVLSGIELIDHKNHNGLDCRRSNIRQATNQQNGRNRVPVVGTSSRFKGVGRHKEMRKWYARIGINGKQIHLGYFSIEIDAAIAYNSAAQKYFGEFARLNRIGENP